MTRTTTTQLPLDLDATTDRDTTPTRRAERAAKQVRRTIADRRDHDTQLADFRDELADYLADRETVARFTLTPRF